MNITDERCQRIKSNGLASIDPRLEISIAETLNQNEHFQYHEFPHNRCDLT